jgi:predicted ATPase/class 3 adenylate cyclase
MHCNKCGFKNPAGIRFCGSCATPLNQESSLSQKCAQCSFVNPIDFQFCGQCATTLDPAPPTKRSSTNTPLRQPEAERRQLTVLFCDIVASSELSVRIDPEELRDIMCDYRGTCREIVSRYDGYVAQFLGDGILVYFGYPQAHEDDARRATRAGLEIIQHIPQLRFKVQYGDDVQLAVRVGMHTGLVVVGEIGGGDKRIMALGETPNITARIQGETAADTVVVSEATRRLLGEDFDCESLGIRHLKGFPQPLELFRVRQLRNWQHRRAGVQARHHATLVGRDQEMALLLERLDQARKEEGQVVLLSGEPGLGKTRMVQLVCERAAGETLVCGQTAGEACALLECVGSPYYRNSFLFPVIDLLRRIFDLNDNSDSANKLARIEQAIVNLGMDAHVAMPVLAELFSIPYDGHPLASIESTPQQKKQLTLDTLVTLLQAIAQQRFLLLIVEDLQWVDTSTLELLTLLVNQSKLTNVFALFTFRNEFVPPWSPRTSLAHITLNRLTRQQTGSMIHQLCKYKTLPPEVFAEIIHKTDGIPFFVEELTNTVLRSSQLVEKTDHYELNMPMAQLGIPATLQDSLMSRLDNLGDDKELAQISATLGREFEHELLGAVSARDEDKLCAGLNRLINAELFFQHGHPPKARYSFRHALLHEAAYHSLLKRTRQQYHQQIAILLEKRFPHTVADNPELLAHHYTEAGNHEAALDYWLTAGRLAVQHSANVEAIAHLHSGLAILDRLPETPHRNLQELAIQTTLGLAAMMSRGYAVPEVERAYARARELCKTLPDIHAVFPILCGLWEFYIVRADLETAYRLAGELQTIATQANEAPLRLEAQRALGTTRFWQGAFSEALAHFDAQTGILSTDASKPGNLTAYCQDTRVAALANAGCVLWLLGYPDQALERAHRALALAKRLAHPFSQAYALHFLGTVLQLRGDRRTTRRHADAGIALCETYGFPFWTATSRMLRAWVDTTNATAANTCIQYQAALDAYEACGNRLAHSYFLALLAELYQRAGKLDKARHTIDKALQGSAATGEGFFTSELWRIKGELLMATTDPDHASAETLFTQALEYARARSAHSLALRAATSLARLWKTQGKDKADKANILLNEQLAHITEGLDTADITIAQDLLDTDTATAIRN